MVFDRFNVEGLYLQEQALMALYSYKATSGIVGKLSVQYKYAAVKYMVNCFVKVRHKMCYNILANENSYWFLCNRHEKFPLFKFCHHFWHNSCDFVIFKRCLKCGGCIACFVKQLFVNFQNFKAILTILYFSQKKPFWFRAIQHVYVILIKQSMCRSLKIFFCLNEHMNNFGYNTIL